jgi:hypothetical protein
VSAMRTIADLPGPRLVVKALNTNHLHRRFHAIRTATERLHNAPVEALAEVARVGSP